MKRKSFEPTERHRRWVARDLRTAVKEAERFGFLPCTDDDKCVGILLAPKLWRLGPLDSESFLTITLRGSPAAYFIPSPMSEIWLGILECLTPEGRRRLPQIACAVAARAEAEKTKKRE
jgi:hypothetical protein